MYIMWALQYIHDHLSKWHIDCWVLHTKWYPSVSYTWTWEQNKWWSMSKQNRRWTSMSFVEKAWLFLGTAHKVVPISEDRQRKSNLNTTSAAGYTIIYIGRSRSKQNRRCTSSSCWHCNACMIICWKGIAFAGRCMQSGTHQWRLKKKI